MMLRLFFKKAKQILDMADPYDKYINDISLYSNIPWSVDESHVFSAYFDRLNAL